MIDNPAWDPISDMEPDVLDIKRWGQVVDSMAQAGDAPSEALRVVAHAIMELGDRLEKQWSAALFSARTGGRR